MESIRIITKIKNKKLNLTVPKEFENSEVEVIITPFKKLNADDDWK